MTPEASQRQVLRLAVATVRSAPAWACLLAGTALTCAVSSRFAAPFPAPGLTDRTVAGAAFFVVTAAACLLYCRLDTRPGSWPRALVGGVIFFIGACVVYSIARHEAVLVPYSALFCLPGAALGGAAGLALRRQGGAPL
jgi:hypothetical protein